MRFLTQGNERNGKRNSDRSIAKLITKRKESMKRRKRSVGKKDRKLRLIGDEGQGAKKPLGRKKKRDEPIRRWDGINREKEDA